MIVFRVSRSGVGILAEFQSSEPRITLHVGQVTRSAAAIEEWRRKHPAQALALRTGLKNPPADLRRLE